MTPSYFYHIAFELYSTPTLNPSTASHEHNQVYVPPSETDIFEKDLPAHKTTPWGGPQVKRPTHRRINTEQSFSSFSRTRTDLPASSSRPRPGQVLPKLGGAVGTEVHSADWRYGTVSIESIDMDHRVQESGMSRPRGKSMTQSASTADTSFGGGSATRAKFIPADPKNTDVGWGVVHLYRDARETPGLYDDTHASSSSDGGVDDTTTFSEESCSTVCILAVPSYMMPSDLLGWVGEQARDDVSHFRLIRTSKANRYMVLMKFRSAKRARHWRKEYNGRAFSSMEPEYCHAVFVQSITFQGGKNSQQPSSFPSMSDDPFLPQSQSSLNTPTPTVPENSLAASLTTRPLAPPPPNLVELPTCPVCLERMDETTGLLTILCQHVFHCDCLSKWQGSGCPVCRYTQNSNLPPTMRTETTENACHRCGSESNLWICLICGNVGCGRYDDAHAFAHFEETGHAYAMDIATQHVWDYVGDGYVHRLIQNKADGKMVDLPDAWNGGKRKDGGMSAMGADMVPREKMDAMGNEYAYLLQSQLENQRSYFEDQLERALDKAGQAAASAEKAAATLDEVMGNFQKLRTQYSESQASTMSLERDLERVTAKAAKMDTLAKKLAKDWKEEKTINEGLMEKLRVVDERMKEGEVAKQQLMAEKADLEEQNRDLSFFITGGEKLREMREQGEEIEGRVEVPVAAEGSGKRKKGKKK